MKILHLVIILVLLASLVIPTVQNAKAMPDLSPQDLYKQSDIVFYGQVISKQTGPNSDYYQIKVITNYKNSQTSDSITATGHKPEGGHVSYPQFEVGDKAIFYITNMDGINTISPYSQKAGDACDVHSFLGPEYFGSSYIPRGYASNPRLLDVNGNALEGMILTNQEVVLSYNDVWNNYPQARTIPVKISIQNENNGHYIFNMTQNLQVQACDFASNLKWNFVPTEIGKYAAKIDVYNKTLMTYGFSVMFDTTSKLQIISSPLKQFKSGVTTQNITCKEGFVIAIKKQGHQPACISPDTVPKLVLRGWSENPLNELLLKYGNQTQANLVFYDIMNEPKIRNWSMTGWRYSDYSYASNGETYQSSATMHLYLPSNIGKHECENGSYGIVVINLNPVEIEHKYTEVGCNIITTTNVDPESNVK